MIKHSRATSFSFDESPAAITHFFDPDWYLETNGDVKDFAGGPYLHYMQHGCVERRSPHPLFDLQWYLSRHPEVASSGIEPLSYYFDRGWRSLHSPHPLFDPAWYLLRNTDIILADIDPLRHYLKVGWTEGRTLHPLFDTKWYLDAYPNVALLNRDPLSHFLTVGWKEGHRPHPLFDTKWYLETNADIAQANINPWIHYIEAGWREGRSPNAQFDAAWYVRHYLGGVSQTCEPLSHYLTEGWREGLLPSPQSRKRSGAYETTAPLYVQVVNELAKASGRATFQLSKEGGRGTIVLVVHETEVGGAPHVLKQFSQWLRDRTRFNIRIVALHGGNLRHSFSETAPLLVLSDHPEGERTDILKDWLGDDVRGVFLNSIASGRALQHLPIDLPVVAFIHELPKILDLYPLELSLVQIHAHKVIGGGSEVTRALQDNYDYLPDRLVTASSFIEVLPFDTDYSQRRTAARTDLKLPEGRCVVMGCGLLHWRKAPEKFIEMARMVLERGIDAEFVWLGGGPDHEACLKLVAEYGLEKRIRFTGYEPDVAGKLAGGDIFVLSSQEDPFPLVALYAAQAGLPIVCFEKAGGIEGFVARGSGIAVPFMNTSAMADAVVDYASDPIRRKSEGLIGRSQVARSHTIDTVGPLLLHYLREAMDMPPEISVVVPNYNYEAYLPERLTSIATQTFQDFELILLDDASSDNSVQLLEDFASLRPGTRVVVNLENSGSPFVQWMRGMGLAQSDLIWLAEADDRCRPEFLETLLPMFDDRNVRIASCASQPITADGAIIGDYRALYLDRIAAGRWDADYVATDHEEASVGLGIANSIPNASAVMFRKFVPEPEFVQELTTMRLCGDWFFYVRAMRGGLVGFSASPLNDHRRHGNTVTHKLEGSPRYFTELAKVRGYLGRTYRQDAMTQARIAEFYTQDVSRFGIEDQDSLPALPNEGKLLPTLLVVAPDLSPGGGQVFAISIANEWARRGGRVVLLNVGNQPTHPAMLAKIATEAMLVDASHPRTDLGTLIQRFDIDVIHSSIWWADRWVDMHRDALPDDMPWVITMHGCHETFFRHPDIDASFPERMARMIARAQWVYTAQKNLQVFERYGRPVKLSRIPNGMNAEPSLITLHRRELGLRDNATVLCLASRAIESKGWHAAVRLTTRLNLEGHAIDLLLIGEGPAADAIRAEAPEHVHLVGQVENLQDYFRIVDIGVLPSYFIGESMPLVLLEMMAQGLPLVATAIGEIPWMLGEGKAAAGLLVPLQGEGVDEEALYASVKQLLDEAYRADVGRASRRRFEEEFTLKKTVDQYKKCYTEVYPAVPK